MEDVIKALSSVEIVGLHTKDNLDDDMYCGKIIGYEDNRLIFQTYDICSEVCKDIQVESSDIVWFEANSADTEYLAKVIANKDIFTIKGERTITKCEIAVHLHRLWENEIPALYHTEFEDDYYAYIVGYDENTIILRSFNPFYNIDYGIICFPIENIEKIEVYKSELNIYPYLYENKIKVNKCQMESTDIRLDFFRRSMNEKKLVDVQNLTDIENDEDLVGYVDSVQDGVIRFRKINTEGIDCGTEEYNVNDIVTFGWEGLYLDRIELLYKTNLLKNAKEENAKIKNRENFISMILDARKDGTVVSLVSDETDDEYRVSTGFVVEVMDNWARLKLYDFEEFHWFECYRRINDFSRIRRNGMMELLVKAISDKTFDKRITKQSFC